MNLQSQITEIRRRIAEPYPDDPSDAQITDDEIVDWLYQAELQVAVDSSDAALSASSGMVYTTSLTPAAGAIDIRPTSSLPEVLRLLGVSLARPSTVMQHPAKMVSYNDIQRAKYDPAWRTNVSHPLACMYEGYLYVEPSGTTGSISLSFVMVPQRRYRRFRGSVTTKTSNTVWRDSKLVTAGYPDDYFTTHGRIDQSVKYTSGEPNGRIVDVSDYTGSTGEVTTAATSWSVSNEAFGPDVNVGDTYEIGENSPFSDLFAGPIYSYVTYLCFCKADDESAQKHLSDYQRQIGQINAAYAEGGVKK